MSGRIGTCRGGWFSFTGHENISEGVEGQGGNWGAGGGLAGGRLCGVLSYYFTEISPGMDVCIFVKQGPTGGFFDHDGGGGEGF